MVTAISARGRRHFPVDFDQFDEAVDAVVGEGHDAVVVEAMDPAQAVLGLHFDCDVEQEVDVLAEVFRDAVDGSDAVDLVDLHGSGRERPEGSRLPPPVPGQKFAPSWDDIGRLAAIAFIRTFLNFFLERDIRETQAFEPPVAARLEAEAPPPR